MWQKPIKKTIFTLALNGWQPEITEISHPLIKNYAKKIGADFYLIKERKLDERFHPTYEKLQIYQLAQEMQNDWNIYIDSDAMIHPDFFDVTNHLSKDTVCHNGSDLMGNRYREDRFHHRDGRHISSCNWFTIASDWCIEIWNKRSSNPSGGRILKSNLIMGELRLERVDMALNSHVNIFNLYSRLSS